MLMVMHVNNRNQRINIIVSNINYSQFFTSPSSQKYFGHACGKDKW